MPLNTAESNPNTFDLVPALKDNASFRGSCSWFERPMTGNQVGDSMQVVDINNCTFLWNGQDWINTTSAFSSNITGTYTLDRGDLDQMKNATGAVVITIPNDTVLGLTTQAGYRACLGVYQEAAGAPTFVAGSGVSAIAGTPKIAGVGVMHGVVRVGENLWAYL